MNKFSLLLLIAFSFQAFAKSRLKTIGKVLINPVISTSFDEKRHHHKPKPVDDIACKACEVPQELGYKARTTQWLKNSWEQLPSTQQLKVSCSKAFDELQFNAYKHCVAIAATVTVALAACGGYYWYKNYYKTKKTDQN